MKWIAATLPLSLLAVACFSEGASGPSSCPTGTRGCPCYADDTCDPALECSMDACVVPGCMPGELDCNCYDGMCYGTLVCEGNACHDTPGGTAATDVAGTTAMSSTDTSSVTTAADTTTTGPVTCVDAGDCTVCRACAEAQACADELAECQADDSCRTLFECTEMCAPGDNPCIAECAMAHGGGATLFQPFAACRACQCPSSCGVPCV